MKGRAIRYSADELAWIEANRALPRAALHAAFVARFGRGDVCENALKALCWRRGWSTGRDGRFPPGHASTAGQRWSGPRPGCVATQFKKGNLPHNTRHLGHERLAKNGYVEISVDKTHPHTGFPRHYVLKHRWLWEQAHGPLPAGMALKCLDGDRLNTDPANWAAVPRATLPRLAGGRWRRLPFDAADPDVKPALLAVARLEHAVRLRRRAAAKAAARADG